MYAAMIPQTEAGSKSRTLPPLVTPPTVGAQADLHRQATERASRVGVLALHCESTSALSERRRRARQLLNWLRSGRLPHPWPEGQRNRVGSLKDLPNEPELADSFDAAASIAGLSTFGVGSIACQARPKLKSSTRPASLQERYVGRILSTE